MRSATIVAAPLRESEVDIAFVHGGGQGSWVWDDTLAALDLQAGNAFGRVVALDAPGCGA